MEKLTCLVFLVPGKQNRNFPLLNLLNLGNSSVWSWTDVFVVAIVSYNNKNNAKEV
jgi:hypothetical protein